MDYYDIGDFSEYEDLPISSLEILPYHSHGFIFKWSLNDSFSAPGPYTFIVQEAPTPTGPWDNISEAVIDRYCWASKRNLVGKTYARNYRIFLIDGSVKLYASEAKLPCGDLSMREFLIAREILRKEELNASRFSATPGQVWISAEYGKPCPDCIDPITRQVRNSHCKKCHGTGFYPSHYGPFDMWFSFSPKQNQNMTHGADGGTKDDRSFSVRAIGTPRLKSDDVIRDINTGKMYYVQSATNAAEVRRIPIVQQLTVSEAITSDQCYDLVQKEDHSA